MLRALVVLLLASVQSVAADVSPFIKEDRYQEAKWGDYPQQRYLSDRDARGPVANILVDRDRTRSTLKNPYVLWAPHGPAITEVRPMMLDSRSASLVWYGPAGSNVTTGSAVQSCNGSRYITFGSGNPSSHDRAGGYLFYNSAYELVYNISTEGLTGYADFSELFVTNRCTAIISGYETRPYNLSKYGIEHGYLKDSFFQEIDIATGKVLFEWQASRYVDVTDSLWYPSASGQGLSKDKGFDFFHINSVQKYADGYYLISARHMCSIYYISGITGEVIWILGGRQNDFRDVSAGRATDFAWQHHARWNDEHDPTIISLLDNHNAEFHNVTDTTRGMILEVDINEWTVSLQAEYNATNTAHAIRDGSMHVLKDGTVVLGYGSQPGWTKFTANGSVILDVALGPINTDGDTAANHRTMQVAWKGSPSWTPRIAPGPPLRYEFDGKTGDFNVATRDASGTALVNNTAYFSWNGATEVMSWIVLASNHTAHLKIAEHFWAQVAKTGFESSTFVGANTRFVRALAVDASDHILGTTDVITLAGDVDPRAMPKGDYRAEALTGSTRGWRAFAKRRRRYHGLVLDASSSSPAGTLSGLFLRLMFGALCLSSLRWRLYGGALGDTAAGRV